MKKNSGTFYKPKVSRDLVGCLWRQRRRRRQTACRSNTYCVLGLGQGALGPIVLRAQIFIPILQIVKQRLSGYKGWPMITISWGGLLGLNDNTVYPYSVGCQARGIDFGLGHLGLTPPPGKEAG